MSIVRQSAWGLLVVLTVSSLWLLGAVKAWSYPLPVSSSCCRGARSTAFAAKRRTNDDPDDDDDGYPDHYERQQHKDSQRRNLLVRQPAKAAVSLLLWSSLTVSSTSILPLAANALVKGNAPPPKTKVGDATTSGGRPKCTNVEDCQAEAERRAEEERLDAQINAVPVSTTSQGTRYRDLVVGTGPTTAQIGDDVTTYYKVLKLGKRSYDGISGEGTVIFSRGYGLEDDEERAGDQTFRTVLGARSNINALNDAVVGMREGGIRRFTVTPDQGWRKPGKTCDGGPGGSGPGGDLKTDYVVVPTATMVSTEACFDTSKQPFPLAYGEQRRMAQRFDQSLIMEVELVRVGTGDSSLL